MMHLQTSGSTDADVADRDEARDEVYERCQGVPMAIVNASSCSADEHKDLAMQARSGLKTISPTRFWEWFSISTQTELHICDHMRRLQSYSTTFAVQSMFICNEWAMYALHK